jgi:2-hydroxychromene-2-carboxylate isomerase
MKTIEFYFDFTSPYSYLAWKKIQNVDLTFNIKPVMVGSIFSAVESTGPGEIKSKREYLFLDCLRKANKLGVELTAPKSLPFSPLPFLRAVISLDSEPELQSKYITFVFEYGWKNGLDYQDLDYFYGKLKKELGIDAVRHEDLENNKESRRALKQNIKEAVSFGVFGVPSFVVGDALYWGLDSVEFLKNEIEDGVGPNLEEKLRLFQSATKNI